MNRSCTADELMEYTYSWTLARAFILYQIGGVSAPRDEMRNDSRWDKRRRRRLSNMCALVWRTQIRRRLSMTIWNANNNSHKSDFALSFRERLGVFLPKLYAASSFLAIKSRCWSCYFLCYIYAMLIVHKISFHFECDSFGEENFEKKKKTRESFQRSAAE